MRLSFAQVGVLLCDHLLLLQFLEHGFLVEILFKNSHWLFLDDRDLLLYEVTVGLCGVVVLWNCLWLLFLNRVQVCSRFVVVRIVQFTILWVLPPLHTWWPSSRLVSHFWSHILVHLTKILLRINPFTLFWSRLNTWVASWLDSTWWHFTINWAFLNDLVLQSC
jgi:hypothetical protein